MLSAKTVHHIWLIFILRIQGLKDKAKAIDLAAG